MTELTDLVSVLATEAVESGDPPAVLAERCDYRTLSGETRLRLMRAGLAAFVGQELHARRVAEHDTRQAPEPDVEARALACDLHRAVDCPDHDDDLGYTWRLARCVQWLVDLPEAERADAVEGERRRNAARRAEAEATKQAAADAERQRLDELVEAEVRAALTSISLVGDDGRMRSLYEFSLADVDYWRDRSSSLAVSWSGREGWFTDAAKALGDAGVDRVADLPADDAKQLADRAVAVWKRTAAEAAS